MPVHGATHRSVLINSPVHPLRAVAPNPAVADGTVLTVAGWGSIAFNEEAPLPARYLQTVRPAGLLSTSCMWDCPRPHACACPCWLVRGAPARPLHCHGARCFPCGAQPAAPCTYSACLRMLTCRARRHAPPPLLQAQLQLQSFEACNKTWSEYDGGRQATWDTDRDIICAENAGDNVSLCQQDEGAPLYQPGASIFGRFQQDLLVSSSWAGRRAPASSSSSPQGRLA